MQRIREVKRLVRKADRLRQFLMRRLDGHGDNYRKVPILMPPEEDDASIRLAQRRKRRGDLDGVDDRGPRKRGRKKKEKPKSANPVGRPRKIRPEGAAAAAAAASREPGKPKRPQNPFFQFCHDQRKKVAAEYKQREGSGAAAAEGGEDLSKKELTKILAERWRCVPAEEKKVSNPFPFKETST